ncbi:MAG: hypothetical protein IPO25_18725 [Saprospiraceae bacterium]|nr:hypothetical protein [Saprospiraceae bacterium]
MLPVEPGNLLPGADENILAVLLTLELVSTHSFGSPHHPMVTVYRGITITIKVIAKCKFLSYFMMIRRYLHPYKLWP